MRMREKLIELIEQAEEQADKRCDFAENCDQCPADNHTINCLDWLKADCLIANGVTIQKWIPVTERLPEMEEVAYKDKAEPSGYGKYFRSNNVLVYTDSGAFAFGILCNGDWDIECSYEYKCVTHWMPLPEPPREVE